MVTGAAGNLGRAVAEAFAGRGRLLVLVDRQRAALVHAFGSDDGRRCSLRPTCWTRQQVDACGRVAIERFGRIDVLCNMAGGFRMGEAGARDDARRPGISCSTSMPKHRVHIARAVVPRMLAAGGGQDRQRRRLRGAAGGAQMGAYCASKSAVIRLTESMAAELREQGINVNCVMPSIIDTPENRRAMPDADPARWVAPHDLAAVVVFLASDAARAVHGAALPVVGLS